MDIRIRVDLFEHPKWRRLISLCGPEGGLALLKLWTWAAVYRQDGNIADLTDQEITAISQITPAKAKIFLSALRDTNGQTPWLNEDGRLHDWHKEQQYIVNQKARIEHAKKMSNARWSKRRKIPDKAPAKAESKANDIELRVKEILSTKGEQFVKTWNAFLATRRSMRCPATPVAQELILQTLAKLAKDEETQIKILERSIERGWRGVFALSDRQNRQTGPTTVASWDVPAEPRMEPQT